MQSKASTVDAYLKELPADRRDAIQAVRAVILKNLDSTYAEGMNYGMIGYYVPHSAYPAGYHCDPRLPLPYIGLGSQKNHMSLHIMCLVFGAPLRSWFEAEWKKAGKKLDAGVGCVRFKKLDDVALDVIGALVKRTPAASYIAQYEEALNAPRTKRPASSRGSTNVAGKKPATKKSPAKKVASKTSATRKTSRTSR
jgi:hypothetical protein